MCEQSQKTLMNKDLWLGQMEWVNAFVSTWIDEANFGYIIIVISVAVCPLG
jgi:hypothetical protein